MVERYNLGMGNDISPQEQKDAWTRVRDRLVRIASGLGCWPRRDDVATFSSHASAPSQPTGPSTSTDPRPSGEHIFAGVRQTCDPFAGMSHSDLFY
jgi:hypothetical protein